MAEHRRKVPFTVQEISELVAQRQDEWIEARAAAYIADPDSLYPIYEMERASDMFYHSGPPSITIELYGMGDWTL